MLFLAFSGFPGSFQLLWGGEKIKKRFIIFENLFLFFFFVNDFWINSLSFLAQQDFCISLWSLTTVFLPIYQEKNLHLRNVITSAYCLLLYLGFSKKKITQ